MPIIFSTTTPASPACQPPARIYFEAPDDALLARVTEKVAELMGRHLSYIFHDEAPGGVTPIILEDVGPSVQPVETTVVNYPHAAGVVPGSLLLKEYPSGRTLTDSGRGHLIDQDGRFAATVDYETGTIHQPQAIPDALTERGAKAWAGVDAQGLREGRWYMVTHDGVATLCEDRRDAEKEAKDADMAWPHSGPHRAVQLVEASTAGFTAADMATASAQYVVRRSGFAKPTTLHHS